MIQTQHQDFHSCLWAVMEVFFFVPEPVFPAAPETVASKEWGRGEGQSLVQTVAHEAG